MITHCRSTLNNWNGCRSEQKIRFCEVYLPIS